MLADRLRMAATSKGVQGQQAYTTAGSYTFTVPAGVTSISMVCVGGAQAGLDTAGGAGGSLAYTNSSSCIAGETFAVVVGAAGSTNTGDLGASSSVTYNPLSTVVCRGKGGGTFVANVGTASFVGGATGVGGGGAAGYSGDGGAGAGGYNSNGVGGAGGGAGGGGGGGFASPPNEGRASGGGGGVGILGAGSSGGGGNGAATLYTAGFGGGGGSGGAAGDYGNSTVGGAGGNGGLYGGAGGGGSFSEDYSPTLYGSSGASGSGAVRIIWGAGRSYPSNAANV